MKLTKSAQIKIKLRYNTKFEEFIKLDKNKLKELFNGTKMSSTDKKALVDAISYILWQERQEQLKQQNISKDENIYK